MPNYIRDFVATRPADDRALVIRGAEGARREWSFGELTELSAAVAAVLAAHGARRGDVVLTMLGSGIDFAAVTLACLRSGIVMLPCSEQLRARDLALRAARAEPRLVITNPRSSGEVDGAGFACPVLLADGTGEPWTVPDAPAEPPPFAELDDEEPAFVLFTSGTTGPPKLVTHVQRYVWGQRLQARHWLGAEPGELAWSTAAPGWSKSTRNSFIAPWFCGAAALLEDGRFDPAGRLETVRTEGVNVLCMAPTEYRMIAARVPIGELPSLRRLVAAGEPLGEPTIDTWREATGITVADGYGQTETGHISAVPPGRTAPSGSMGRPLPGIDVRIVDGELCVDPATVPSFFLGYDHRPVAPGWWHTGDHVHADDDGWLFFESRADDVILSAGYRIGPAEVEAVLLGHPAVGEVAVVGTPDADRGEAVTAVVVLRDGFTASPELVRQLQEFVKAETAPYKYPRHVRFVDALPKTNSGKIHRSELREQLSR